MSQSVRNLCLILGDQLNFDSELFNGFDPQLDRILMMEVRGESIEPASGFQRTVLFLSAMRHFAQSLIARDYPVIYLNLDQGVERFSDGLTALIDSLRPERLRLVLPGDYRVLQEIRGCCDAAGLALQIEHDNHFIAQPGEFSRWMKGRKQLRMEHWYRHLRKRTGVLMCDGQPEAGQWNFDAANRKSFGRAGPDCDSCGPVFENDQITQQVIRDVSHYLPQLAGSRESFNWPVTRVEALQLLDQFIETRLPRFGDYQDAMWTGQPFLYHAWIASSLNLKLLNPREVIGRALQAYSDGIVPINAVEGFVRQILGWREYVRGLYWYRRDLWQTLNGLEHDRPLPEFYWHGQTGMQCLKQSISQVLETGYGHHIQRLMVTGLFALLYGVDPQAVHRWYLAIYVDAVAWVEVPNTLAMSQYADLGFLASKPYIASGNYIKKMSNYCQHCPYNPAKASGADACPFTTLYWRFVDRHQALLQQNPRSGFQVKHWLNKSEQERQAIRNHSNEIIGAIEIL